MKLPNFTPFQPIPCSILSVTVGAFLAVSGSSNAAVLASWDTWSDSSTPYAANSVASGLTATVTTATNRINTGFGSTDGAFGTVAGASTTLGGLLLRESSGDLTATITITNGSGSDYSIDSLHFDFGVRTLSADSFTLTYTSGGLGVDGTLIGSETALAETIGVAQGAGEGNTYYNFDYTLSSVLSDTVLSIGESATFTFVASGTGTQDSYSVNGSSILDNIAFQGSVIPEPSFATLGLLGTLGLLRRRRR